MPVMDVRLRFGIERHEHDDQTCIIVINYHEITYDLKVDGISEVMIIQEENIVGILNMVTVL